MWDVINKQIEKFKYNQNLDRAITTTKKEIEEQGNKRSDDSFKTDQDRTDSYGF